MTVAASRLAAQERFELTVPAGLPAMKLPADNQLSAERIELTPVFTLGAGDTTTRRDQLIKSVNTNEVAFLNNQFPIEAYDAFLKQIVPRWLSTDKAIIDGRYREGDLLPSVRAFAAEQGANPLTVAKAYQQFQADGLIRVQTVRYTLQRT